MDESTQAQPQNAAPREMMFCHECQDEWYRDQGGIICPECGSEFTEIIEDGNDPRDNAMLSHDHDDDDASMNSDEMPGLQSVSHSRNPFRLDDDDDPEEADISQYNFEPLGPGRLRVSATIHRTISPAAFGAGGNGPNTIGGITSFLTNLLQNGAAQRQQQAEAGDGQGGSAPRAASPGGPHIHRFHYSSDARLRPRDGDNPGPRLEPVDDLNNVLAGLFAAFGEPPGGQRGPGHNHPHDHGFGDMPMNPLMGLFAALSGGQHGDFVTSQEAMDRIISQLMEQTATSNAPGPASQADIDSLPRKKISKDMLGDDGKADCSICMDEVAPEEEVTELPCKHWFHHQCVSAWLKEHDTCPHCRKGITKADENASRDRANRSASSSGADPTANMPGAFGAAGEGTSDNPFVMPGSSPPAAPAPAPSSDNTHPNAANESSNNAESAAERARRSWWP